ncbi:MAG TPA: preprotein translocase subunit SecG [Pyrinomonadaceae bacterium]
MFTYILYGLFILSCVVLIISILLQPGKADAGALFSSGLSSTAFGPRGTASLLAKITVGAAAVFMLAALTLALPSLSGGRSVLQGASSTTPTATPTPAPATSPLATQPVAQPSSSTAPATSPAASPAASKSK